MSAANLRRPVIVISLWELQNSLVAYDSTSSVHVVVGGCIPAFPLLSGRQYVFLEHCYQPTKLQHEDHNMNFAAVKPQILQIVYFIKVTSISCNQLYTLITINSL
jgi:hypothetical protein